MSVIERTPKEIKQDEEIKTRVLRGIELLKRQYGEGWVEKITPERLDLADGARCVLGQVYGEYTTGCDILGLDSYKEDASDRRGATHYGFLMEEGRPYTRLTETWLEEIEKII